MGCQFLRSGQIRGELKSILGWVSAIPRQSARPKLCRQSPNMNNKIGIYYAYWTHDWDADFVPFVARVKRLGFDILEVNAGTVTNLGVRERDRLKRCAER